MKKLLLLGLTLLPCAALAAPNKIGMVTYFPVPYVAYSQVDAANMDVGLTDSCSMKLGCDTAAVPLKADTVNLQSGRLDLNGGKGIAGGTLTLGGTASAGGKISFRNVRIYEGHMESVNAADMKVGTLKLFDKQFPSCKDKDGTGQMRWTSLKLKGASSDELYLQCGGLLASAEPKTDCSDRTYKLAHKSECCVGSSTSDTDCWGQNCSYKWEKEYTTSSVSGVSGYNTSRSPKGDCVPGTCRPTYDIGGGAVSWTGGSCITESNAVTILEKTNIKKCPSSYREGASCGAHQENEFCYNDYAFSDSYVPPCMYYSIRVSDGLKCKKSCIPVKTY